MELEVPDDYQVPSTHPWVFWKDIKKKLGKKNVPDIWKGGAFNGIDQCEFDGFYIDNMILDYLQKVYIHEDDGSTTEINLEHIPLHQ